MTLRTVPLGVFPYDRWTLSSDGKLLAHVSQIEAKPDQLAIIVREFTTGHELRTFVSRSEGLGHLTFSRDNRWLLFSSGRSSALWDLTSGETKAIPAMREVDLSPDGQWLASYSDTLPTRITLMNLLTGAKRTVQASSPMGSIGFSPSGRYLTAGHDGPIFVWEVETGRRVFLARIDVATGWKSFCPDERCILTGSTTKPLQLWDIATGREMIPDLSRLMRWETHSFSPDMHWLATIASDGSVEIWNLAARTLVASLYVLNGGKSWLVRTPSGFFDVSDDSARRLITWNVGNQLYPADRFSRQRQRPGLLAALFAGREIAIASTERRR
jgi:WD40 repeat protein